MVLENGIYRAETPEEIAMMAELEPSFKEKVVVRIREMYSVDDELAILRQRESKPEEFLAYNEFVERIKSEERSEKDDT